MNFVSLNVQQKNKNQTLCAPKNYINHNIHCTSITLGKEWGICQKETIIRPKEKLNYLHKNIKKDETNIT